jgi:hypothetical protein
VGATLLIWYPPTETECSNLSSLAMKFAPEFGIVTFRNQNKRRTTVCRGSGPDWEGTFRIP